MKASPQYDSKLLINVKMNVKKVIKLRLIKFINDLTVFGEFNFFLMNRPKTQYVRCISMHVSTVLQLCSNLKIDFFFIKYKNITDLQIIYQVFYFK